MFRRLEITIETINLSGTEHIHLILYTKAFPVTNYLVNSIDVRNHTSYALLVVP